MLTVDRSFEMAVARVDFQAAPNPFVGRRGVAGWHSPHALVRLLQPDARYRFSLLRCPHQSRYKPRVADRRSGEWVFRGTGMLVAPVFENLELGTSIEGAIS
jgi:hypothetical protein